MRLGCCVQSAPEFLYVSLSRGHALVSGPGDVTLGRVLISLESPGEHSCEVEGPVFCSDPPNCAVTVSQSSACSGAAGSSLGTSWTQTAAWPAPSVGSGIDVPDRPGETDHTRP